MTTGTHNATTNPSNEMKVRCPLRKDFSAIQDISNWAIGHTTANFHSEPDGLDHWLNLWKASADQFPWFVAEHRGVVIGFAMALPFHGRCGFHHVAEVSVYVHPEHLNQGVGRALYRRLLPALEVQGFHAAVAGIVTPNEASERLHESFGFKKVGLLTRMGWKFGRWHDLAYWQRTLQHGSEAPQPIKSADGGCLEALVDNRPPGCSTGTSNDCGDER